MCPDDFAWAKENFMIGQHCEPIRDRIESNLLVWSEFGIKCIRIHRFA